MKNYNNEFEALLRASVLYHYYKGRAPRMIKIFWMKIQNVKNSKEIHFVCDLLQAKLGGKAGIKHIKQRQLNCLIERMEKNENERTSVLWLS